MGSCKWVVEVRGDLGRLGTVGATGGRDLPLHAAVLLEALALHGLGVLLEAFPFAAVQGAKAGEEIVGEGVSVGFASQRFSRPPFPSTGPSI